MPQDSQATFALQIDRQNCGESLLQAETRGSLFHRAFRDRPSDDYADLGLAAFHPMTSDPKPENWPSGTREISAK